MRKENETKLDNIIGKDSDGNLFVKGDTLYNTVRVINGKTVYLGTKNNHAYVMILGKEPKDLYVEKDLGNSDNLLTLLDESTPDLVENTLLNKDLSNINNKEEFDVISNYLLKMIGYSETERIFEVGFKIANKLNKYSDKDEKMLKENRLFLLNRFKKSNKDS